MFKFVYLGFYLSLLLMFDKFFVRGSRGRERVLLKLLEDLPVVLLLGFSSRGDIRHVLLHIAAGARTSGCLKTHSVVH